MPINRRVYEEALQHVQYAIRTLSAVADGGTITINEGVVTGTITLDPNAPDTRFGWWIASNIETGDHAFYVLDSLTNESLEGHMNSKADAEREIDLFCKRILSGVDDAN